MFSSLTCFIIGALVVSQSFGARLPDPLLVGGIDSSWGDFPSAAFIRTPFLSYCGAAVIHPEFVLTLAQCVYNETTQLTVKPTNLELIAGDLNIFPESSQRQARNVLEVIVHQNYSEYNFNNDIALLRVDRPFTLPSNTVELAVRRGRIVPNGAVCELPGWGILRTTSVGKVESSQKHLSLEILDRDECNEANVHAGHVREDMLCAGNLFQSSNAACSGNFGSPLYCEGQLTGMLSFGVNCGLPNDPPVFTQVRYFNRWIDEQIRDRLEEGDNTEKSLGFDKL